jgi:hypothetical protein
MDHIGRDAYVRRVAVRIAGAAGLVALTFVLTQCQMVTDNLTGVSVGAFKSQGAKCVTGCQNVANDAIRLESRVHVLRVKACNGNETCLAEEEARHEAAVEAIQAQREDCVSGCHHQGGGDGGN